VLKHKGIEMKECPYAEDGNENQCPSRAIHHTKRCTFKQWDWGCNLSPVTMEMLAKMKGMDPNSPQVYKFRELLAQKVY